MKCLCQERKIQKVYLWVSFLTSAEKEELMLLLGINFIVKETITIRSWMWSIAAPFLKGSSLQVVPGWDMLGGQPCPLPCETKGSHLTVREKLGQITASKPGQKKQCRWGTIAVWPIIANVVISAGAGLDFQLNSWEKCIIYWHYFANYFNAIFITALNNKP